MTITYSFFPVLCSVVQCYSNTYCISHQSTVGCLWFRRHRFLSICTYQRKQQNVRLYVFEQVYSVPVQSAMSREYRTRRGRPILEHLCWTVILISTCLQLSSVGILSIAFIINQKFYKWSNFTGTELITAPKILLVIGLGLFVIAIIGLCGVLRDSGCLLTLVCVPQIYIFPFLLSTNIEISCLHLMPCSLSILLVFHTAYNRLDRRTSVVSLCLSLSGWNRKKCVVSNESHNFYVQCNGPWNEHSSLEFDTIWCK